MKPDKWAEKETELMREIEDIKMGAIRVESPIFAKLPLIKLDQLRECKKWNKEDLKKKKIENDEALFAVIEEERERHRKELEEIKKDIIKNIRAVCFAGHNEEGTKDMLEATIKLIFERHK